MGTVVFAAHISYLGFFVINAETSVKLRSRKYPKVYNKHSKAKKNLLV